MKRVHLVVLTALATLLLGCETDTTTLTDAFILQPEKIQGESDILAMENERQYNPGRLKSFLEASDPKVRARAALAIGRLKASDLAAPLAERFGDQDAEVRASALFAAGLLRDDSLAAAVANGVSDPVPGVATQAVFALSKFGGASPPPALLAALRGAEPQIAGEACLAVSRYPDPSVADDVLPWLTHDDPEVRWKAAYALYRLGQGTAELLVALDDPDPRVRHFAARGLGAVRAAEAVDPLLALLTDPDTNVVAAAAIALGDIGDPAASDGLVALIHDPVTRRSLAAVHALSRSGLAPETLRELVRDESPHVRSLGVRGLANTNAGRQVFIRASEDLDWRVRAAAVSALADRGDTRTLAKQIQYDPDARVIPAVLEGLDALGFSGLDTLILKHLGDTDAVVRATAARLLVGRDTPNAVDKLLGAWEASRSDEILIGKLAVIEALAATQGSDLRLNPIKQSAASPNWILKNRGYALLNQIGEAGSTEAPKRVGTLRTSSYYRDLTARGDFDYRATFYTGKGEVVFRLYPKTAQLSVAFIEEVASTGYYTDIEIRDILPLEGLFGGDDRGDGHGYFLDWVRDEPTRHRFDKINLSLLRPYGRDSGSSQFLITYMPRPDLDLQGSPIGELIAGEDVLEALAPGDLLLDVRITSHEFTGTLVQERVEIDLSTPEPTTSTAGTTAGPVFAQGQSHWRRPPILLYMMIVAGIMLLFSLSPVIGKFDDIPLAVWAIVAMVLVLVTAYAAMIWTGIYFDLMTHETPGARFEGMPNPPIMSDDLGYKVTFGAMGIVMLEAFLLFFFTSGKKMARWGYLFLALVEIGLLAAQLATGLTVVYVISNVGIVMALLKIWFLLMDRQLKEFFVR